MMLRILAFALNASASLNFTRGISTDDEPDIWQKSLSDEIVLWVDLGQPDEKRIRKACGRAERVIIYTYKRRSASVWWEQVQGKLSRFNNLEVVHLDVQHEADLGKMAARNMQLQCTIQDGTIWLSNEAGSVEVEAVVWK